MNSTGASTDKAIRALNAAGITVAALADDLGVHPATVRRWRRAATRPNPRNYTALRQLVDDLIGPIQHRRGIANQRQLSQLQSARDALLTVGERAAMDQLAASVRDALLGQTPTQRRSITADTDPFIVVHDSHTDALNRIEEVLA